MGAALTLDAKAPFLAKLRQRDVVHAKCSAHVARRLERTGWRVATEVEVGGDRSRGWIDVLAWHPATGLLLVIEIKTELHDLGAIERSLGWYEREAWAAARQIGWRPRRVLAACWSSRRRPSTSGSATTATRSLDRSRSGREISRRSWRAAIFPNTAGHVRLPFSIRGPVALAGCDRPGWTVGAPFRPTPTTQTSFGRRAAKPGRLPDSAHRSDRPQASVPGVAVRHSFVDSGNGPRWSVSP